MSSAKWRQFCLDLTVLIAAPCVNVLLSRSKWDARIESDIAQYLYYLVSGEFPISQILQFISYIANIALFVTEMCTPWWRYQMGTFPALLALCAGNSPVTVTRSFDAFFDLRLNTRLSKQPLSWWFETPSCSLWRHGNDMHISVTKCCTMENRITALWNLRDGSVLPKSAVSTTCLQITLLKHTEAMKKWTPFRRRHFQVRFLEWKYTNFA